MTNSIGFPGRRFVTAGLALLGMAFTASATANGCVILGSTSKFTVGQGTPVLIPGNASEGDVIKTGMGNSGGNQWQMTCDPGTYSFVARHVPSSSGDIVPLRVAGFGVASGVGIRLSVREHGSGSDGAMHRFPWTVRRTFDEDVKVSFTDDLQYELIRMSGELYYGAIEPVQVGTSYVEGGDGEYRSIWINDLSFSRPSCGIEGGDGFMREVALGTHSSSVFARPGDASPWVPFALTSANCSDPGGVFADITFGFAHDADADDSTLFAMPTGKVKGVGIEVAQDNVDSTSFVPGVKGTMPAVSTGNHYKFKARLKRTTAALQAGSFRRATIVMVEFR
ncbi:fimbrial protein [Dyella terrae]|nr:fimbrial protein [Dyella terrae]